MERASGTLGGVTITLTTAQIKRVADIAKDLGLAAVIGGLGDGAVYGTRLKLDTYSVLVGLALLVSSVVLSRWEQPADAGDGATACSRG